MVDKNGHEYDISYTETTSGGIKATFWCKYLGRSIKNGYRTYTFHYWCKPYDEYDGDGWTYRDNSKLEIQFDDSDTIRATSYTRLGTDFAESESIATMPEYVPLTRYIAGIEAESAIFNTETNESHDKP